MLSTVSRAAARGVATVGVVGVSSSSAAAQLLPRHAPAISTSLVAARALAVSAVARLPAKKAATSEKTTTTSPKKSAAEKAPKKTSGKKTDPAAPKKKKKKEEVRMGRPPIHHQSEEAVAEKKLKNEIRQLKIDALIKGGGPDLLPTHPGVSTSNKT